MSIPRRGPPPSSPRVRLRGTIALVLVVTGLLGVELGATEAPRGPSLAGPLGVATLPLSSEPPGGLEVPPTYPTTSPAPTPRASTTSTAALVVHPLLSYSPRSRPARLEIPRLGLAVGLDSLGLNADGSVQVPRRYSEPGWFRGGPTPGERGSSVILGHVDSGTGPAVFYRLGELRPGDLIQVTLANAQRVRFIVIGLLTYAKDNFPSENVYGARPYAALQLVTCGGAFDRSSGHYLSNLVLYSVMTARAAR